MVLDMANGLNLTGRLSNAIKYALEERDKMIERDGYLCWRCGRPLLDTFCGRAHRLARTRNNLSQYGPYVLDHRENIKHSCEACNSYAMRFADIQEQADMLAVIYADLQQRGLPCDGARAVQVAKNEAQMVYREKIKRDGEKIAARNAKISARKRAAYQAKKEAQDAYHREYYHANKERMSKQNKRHKLSVRIEEYEAKMFNRYGYSWPGLMNHIDRHYLKNLREKLQELTDGENIT